MDQLARRQPIWRKVGRGWSRPVPNDWPAGKFLEKRSKGLGDGGKELRSLFGGGEGGVAKRARGRQVLEVEIGADLRAAEEVGVEISRAGVGIVRDGTVDLHQSRAEMHHHRRLEFAGVAH